MVRTAFGNLDALGAREKMVAATPPPGRRIRWRAVCANLASIGVVIAFWPALFDHG